MEGPHVAARRIAAVKRECLAGEDVCGLAQGTRSGKETPEFVPEAGFPVGSCHRRSDSPFSKSLSEVIRDSRSWGHVALPDGFDPEEPLSRSHWEHFAQYIALGGLKPDAAYLAMGGTGKDPIQQALKLKRKPMIRERIAWLQKERMRRQLEDVTYTREDVLRVLIRNVDEARNQVHLHRGEVVKDEDGTPILKPDVKAVNTAVELLGRELGMFPREAKIRHEQVGALDGMTLDELLGNLKNTLWEASDGAIDLDVNALLTAVVGSTDPAGGSGADGDSGEEDQPLQALPQTAALPPDGEEQAREVLPSWKPAGEDDLRIR